MAAYLVHHPYFLIFVAGVAFGGALSCVVLSVRPRRRTVSVRRRCRIVVPASLIVTVVGAGTGYINTIPERDPAGGAIVFTVAVLVTIGTVLLPRWWRLVVIVPPILTIAVTIPLWIPYPAVYLDPQATTTVTVIDDATTTAGTSQARTPRGRRPDVETTVPVALLHIRPVSRPDLLELTLAPVSDLLPPERTTPPSPVTPPAGTQPTENGGTTGKEVGDGSPGDGTPGPGPWSTPLRVPLDGAVDITLTVLRHPPELWWFPPDGLPLELTVAVAGESRTFERYASSGLALRIREILASFDAATTEDIHLRFPEDTTTYLQPGVYLIGVERVPQIIR